jgi:phage anti-repressor protein
VNLIRSGNTNSISGGGIFTLTKFSERRGTSCIEQYGFTSNHDYVSGSPVSGNQSRGGDRRSREYHLTLDMAKELSMMKCNAKSTVNRCTATL